MTTSVPAPPIASIGQPPQEVIDALLAGVVNINRRVEIYQNDGITPFDIEFFDGRMVDGQVTIDGTRDERRMCEFTLENQDGALNLNPVDGFFYDNILKCYWGIEYYVDSVLKRWETQIGEFMIDRIDADLFPDTIIVTGRDYAKKCLNSQIMNSMQFSPDTPIDQIITAVAANAGISKFRIPYIGLGFQDSVVFEPGTPRWAVMKKVSESIGYEIYFTQDGYLTMRPYQDPVTSPLVWTFSTDRSTGSLVDYRRSSNDSRIKNHCVVIGATVTDDSGISTTAYGEAINDDPSSPTRRDKIGDRGDIFRSEYITETDQAQSLAESRLRVSALEEYSIDFSSAVLPWIEANDIVDIIDPNASVYVPARFLMTNYGISMQLGSMSGVGKRVTIVGTTRTFGVS